jgi:hypothetical protein
LALSIVATLICCGGAGDDPGPGDESAAEAVGTGDDDGTTGGDETSNIDTGDGDGSTSGDGDGSTTGDGDGSTSTTGDGDGSTTGDGDGDGDPPGVYDALGLWLGTLVWQTPEQFETDNSVSIEDADGWWFSVLKVNGAVLGGQNYDAYGVAFSEPGCSGQAQVYSDPASPPPESQCASSTPVWMGFPTLVQRAGLDFWAITDLTPSWAPAVSRLEPGGSCVEFAMPFWNCIVLVDEYDLPLEVPIPMYLVE